MSYLRGTCGVNGMHGESNESVHVRFIMSSMGEGMNCRVMVVVKGSILK